MRPTARQRLCQRQVIDVDAVSSEAAAATISSHDSEAFLRNRACEITRWLPNQRTQRSPRALKCETERSSAQVQYVRVLQRPTADASRRQLCSATSPMRLGRYSPIRSSNSTRLVGPGEIRPGRSCQLNVAVRSASRSASSCNGQAQTPYEFQCRGVVANLPASERDTLMVDHQAAPVVDDCAGRALTSRSFSAGSSSRITSKG